MNPRAQALRDLYATERLLRLGHSSCVQAHDHELRPVHAMDCDACAWSVWGALVRATYPKVVETRQNYTEKRREERRIRRASAVMAQNGRDRLTVDRPIQGRREQVRRLLIAADPFLTDFAQRYTDCPSFPMGLIRWNEDPQHTQAEALALIRAALQMLHEDVLAQPLHGHVVVQTTEEDLEKGQRHDPTGCALARAVQRAGLHRALVYKDELVVGTLSYPFRSPAIAQWIQATDGPPVDRPWTAGWAECFGFKRGEISPLTILVSHDLRSVDCITGGEPWIPTA